jgi:AraC-like DNA-binding protein
MEGTFEGFPPNVNDIAAELGISGATFKNRFIAHYGKPFYQLYIDKKMERAAMLLKEGCKATNISKMMGYSHPIKFNKMFQKHFGITPKKYQMENDIFVNDRARVRYESVMS